MSQRDLDERYKINYRDIPDDTPEEADKEISTQVRQDDFLEEKPKVKKFFGKILDNIGFALLVSPFIIIPIASLIIGIYYSFDNIVQFLTKIGFGYWFVGLIIVPLSIGALVQMLRGTILLFEADANNLGLNDKKQDWKASLYVVINFLGYAALYLLLKRI